MKSIRMIKENDLYSWKVGDIWSLEHKEYDGHVCIEIEEPCTSGYITAEELIKLGYAEYIEDREGIGDMGVGYEIYPSDESIEVFKNPFNISSTASFIDATLRLNKIVHDCNEGKEWEGPDKDYRTGYEVMLDRDGTSCVSVRWANLEWNTFKSEEDAEWSMKEHKELWEIYFKGLTELV